MADEQADRLYKRKRLRDPDNPSATYYIDVPVIYKANFKTMAEQAQERLFFIDNSFTGDRKTRTQTVRNPQHPTMRVECERIQRIKTKTLAEQAQEHFWYIVNDDPPPAHADGSFFNDNPSHEKKHFVRYQGKRLEAGEPVDEPDAWVDIELIDTIKIHCPTEQHQDYLLYPRWPRPEDQDPVDDAEDPFQPLTLAICNEDLELIEGPDNDIDPPYRLDPFQNIVNVHWPREEGVVEQIFIFRRYGASCGEANLAAAQNTGGGDWYPVTREQWIEWASNGQTLPAADNPTGNPTGSILGMPGIASRTKLSDLITACLSLSHQAAQNPGPNDGANGWNPWIVWLNYSGQPQLSCSPTLVDPFPVAQPSAENASHLTEQYPPGSGIFKPHFIYLGVVGFADEDDLGTDGWDDLVGSYPPFVPPT